VEGVIVIELKNINKCYHLGSTKVQALKNVSFKINSGDFVAVIGPSGSGKSTLMNILGCLTVPDSGEYTIDDIDIINASDDKLAEIRNCKIGFVFQNFNLLAKLTALENVELPLIYRGIKRKERYLRSVKALNMVNLSDRMQHKPKELSGGQQQRAAIARALVSEPEIILADEPTGNLDSKAGKDIMNLLSELNSQGKTIVLITHDLTVAQYAKRIMRIIDGELQDQLIT
jgi:putative ABC transport system ATP-binding protein